MIREGNAEGSLNWKQNLGGRKAPLGYLEIYVTRSEGQQVCKMNIADDK